MIVEGDVLVKVDDEDIVNGTFEIPDTVHEIDVSAFARCKSLTSITIPNSIDTMDEWSFAERKSLQEIWIPEHSFLTHA